VVRGGGRRTAAQRPRHEPVSPAQVEVGGRVGGGGGKERVGVLGEKQSRVVGHVAREPGGGGVRGGSAIWQRKMP